jgi:hypothetical protein
LFLVGGSNGCTPPPPPTHTHTIWRSPTFFHSCYQQELGREVIKTLKNARSLTPFATAVALSVAHVHRFEDAVFDMLKVKYFFVFFAVTSNNAHFLVN